MATTEYRTSDLIKRLPEGVRNRIAEYKKELLRAQKAWEDGFEGGYWHIQTMHAKIHAYTTALKDAGIVNDLGRRMLYSYGTTVVYNND